MCSKCASDEDQQESCYECGKCKCVIVLAEDYEAEICSP